MPIDNSKAVGCTSIEVVATTGAGTRLDVEGYFPDAIEVTGISGDTIQMMGSILRGSAGVALGAAITANGIYPLVIPPWTTDMPLTEVWSNKTVDGAGTPVITLHYTRRF